MTLGIWSRGGYYDDNGDWQRTKYCFVSCGDKCTCVPPGGRWYSAAHDKRVTEAEKEAKDDNRQ